VLVGLFAASGASCPQTVKDYTSMLPRALPPSPTLDQVIQVVNNNSRQIQSFHSSHATLAGQGFPTLRAMVAFQRPKRFRLRAETSITGAEVDLGSNDELFWFWVKRNQPPALFYCRYDQFYNSPARQMLAIDPDWLIEAFGLTEFDPRLPHQGPFPLPGERVEIRTLRETPQGPQTKITVVDSVRGIVLEQHIIDFHGRKIASALSSGHRRDPATNLIMPTVVSVASAGGQPPMTIDLGQVFLNRLTDASAELWTPPNDTGARPVDLADPRTQRVAN